MEVLTTQQMYDADAATIAAGTPAYTLMENAGKAVVDKILMSFEKVNTLVICGPGNNGGDGFVVARLLAEEGWDVHVALLSKRDNFKDAAKLASDAWQGEVSELSEAALDGVGLVVDALFGVGLQRNIEGAAKDLIEKSTQEKIDVVAVDIPSGVDGNTGEIKGIALPAKYTVTFARKKLGHVLLPGKGYAGEVTVADIGIAVTGKVNVWENLPELWLERFPFKTSDKHKYDYGHVVVSGGGIDCTGAAKLAAISALRIGAGLVTVATPEDALSVYAESLTSVMVKPCSDINKFKELIEDKRKNAILIGPGNGVTEVTKQHVFTALELQKSCVIDADAITVFQNNPQELFDAIKSPVVLTPHEGEFSRIFDFEGSRMERAKQAAALSKSVVLLKGGDTIIASPEGKVVINTNAPPYLATAGSGDVLAGIIVGLLAAGMEEFEAACAGAWIHGEAADICGPGLISEEISGTFSEVLKQLASY